MRKLWVLALVLFAAVEGRGQTCSFITSSLALPDGQVGAPYSAIIKVSCGNKAALNRTLGYPPIGLNISGSLGTITGAPAVAGNWYFQMKVSGSAGSTLQNFYIKIHDVLSITPQQITTLSCGQNSTVYFQATGGWPPYTWSLSDGNLPPGMVLLSDGRIVGTPDCTGLTLPATFDFTVKATDSQSQTSLAGIGTVMQATP